MCEQKPWGLSTERVTYVRSLSNEEANTIHEQVIATLKDKFGVEIR